MPDIPNAAAAAWRERDSGDFVFFQINPGITLYFVAFTSHCRHYDHCQFHPRMLTMGTVGVRAKKGEEEEGEGGE